MQSSDLQPLKQKLESIREAIELPLRWRDEIAVDTSPDTLDQIQNAANREIAIRQMESHSSRLREVVQALQRFDEGTFGICSRCNSHIGLKRLQAVPWAEYCLPCQNTVEREGHQTGDDQITVKVPFDADAA